MPPLCRLGALTSLEMSIRLGVWRGHQRPCVVPWDVNHAKFVAEVFSFRLRSLAFEISSRDRSPKILSRGLWSTAMIRLVQPSTKKRALSRASATARASPSTGAWRDSAAWVKRLPTNVIFHPVWQQKGTSDGHLQCFWNSQKPMPCFDQSVARQVGLNLSKMRTPSSISRMMTSLDSLNILSRVSSQWNGVPGFSSSQNGNIRSAVAKAYETWLTRPNQERMSVVLPGVGKLWMASKYFLQGRTLLGVISKPVNSTVSAPKTNLSGLRVMPWWPQRSSQVTA